MEEQVAGAKTVVIWVDGDACPRPALEVVLKAMDRLNIYVKVVGNRFQKLPKNPRLSLHIVDKGPDEADRFIIDSCKAFDLIITADIPFAVEAIKKGAVVINPKGDELTDSNIGMASAMRDLKTFVRDELQQRTGGPPPYDQRAKVKFANAFDRQLAKLFKGSIAT